MIVMFFAVLNSAGISDDASEPKMSPIEPEAMSTLMNMAQNLSTLKKVTVKIKNGYDAVQQSGQKIEFGSVRIVKYKKPDLCRFDVTQRNGNQRGFVFDGENITVFDAGEKVYAMTPKPGTCDDAIDYFKKELQSPLPLSQLFNSKLPEMLKELITEATLIEESVLEKDTVSHIAFRTEEVDVQVWVDTKKNLPKRVIISYKNAPEHPQFWAYFKDWDLSPWLRESQFKYEPPKGYEKIMFSPVKIMEMKEEKKNVEK
jgi:hypothetical protein